MVNLKIRNAETARLGLDEHVCELQLKLKSFADLEVPLPFTYYLLVLLMISLFDRTTKNMPDILFFEIAVESSRSGNTFRCWCSTFLCCLCP